MSYEVKNFDLDVLERSHGLPVLVDFWAPWCAPCKMLGAVIEGLAAGANGRWALVKVNTEEHPDLAERFEIKSIPTVKLFQAGAVMDQFHGALPEREIRQWLKKRLPSPHAASLLRAEKFLAEGSLAEAAQLLEPIVQSEPDNETACVLMAESMLGLDAGRIEALLRSITHDSDDWDKAEGLRKLAKLVAPADRPELLPEGAVRESYLEAVRSLKAGEFSSALEGFIDVLLRKRDYYNGSAKEACKAIIQFLGIRHPIVQHYYRAFTSAMYS